MDGGNARRDCTIKVGKMHCLNTVPSYHSFMIPVDSTIHAELLRTILLGLILMEILTSGARVAYSESC